MIHKKTLLTLLVFLFLSGSFIQAQHFITGHVADSLSEEPLPYVNIILRGTTRGTQTNAQGKFSIQASLFDTLQFSFVGYRTLKIVIRDATEPIEIRMPMVSVLLNSVTAYGNMKLAGIPKLPRKSNWITDQSSSTTPQYGTIQTVGVGYTFKNVFSGFSKSAKEKEKVEAIKAENSKVTTYIDVVNSPEVKGELMKKYSLTEEGFYDLLAKYNQEHYKSMYSLDSKSLIASISYFFSSQLNKK